MVLMDSGADVEEKVIEADNIITYHVAQGQPQREFIRRGRGQIVQTTDRLAGQAWAYDSDISGTESDSDSSGHSDYYSEDD